jgi:hypothetical protein
MALFNLAGIFSAAQTLFTGLSQLATKIKDSFTRIFSVFSDAQKLVDTVLSEIEAWKNFKQDLRFSSRVINLEAAIAKTKDLIQGIPDSWNAIKDLVKEFKSQLETSEPAAEAAETAEEVETGGLKQLASDFPKLAKGLEKILGVLAVITGALEAVSKVIADLQTIVDELKRIRLEIEKLDTIFLSQSNKRKVVHLEDGSTMKIRVGRLHPS